MFSNTPTVLSLESDRSQGELDFDVVGAGWWVRSLLLLSDLYVASPRFFARLQSLPDSFQLPEKKPLATQMIGNGVPVNLAAEVVSQTLALCS